MMTIHILLNQILTRQEPWISEGFQYDMPSEFEFPKTHQSLAQSLYQLGVFVLRAEYSQ